MKLMTDLLTFRTIQIYIGSVCFVLYVLVNSFCFLVFLFSLCCIYKVVHCSYVMYICIVVN